MFKFKMLTKVLVAVLYFGQLIELNVNICIALSIERARPMNRVKLYKATQFQGRQMLPNYKEQSDDADPLINQIFAASRSRKTISSRLPRRLLRHLKKPHPRNAHQTLESTGRVDYFGTIEVGTPAKKFLVMFDTTSSEFWLPSASCKSDDCISRMRYNDSESTTYKPDGRQVRLSSDGISLEAHLSSDRVKFANFELDDVTFAEATKLVGDKLKSTPVDGYMGLGFNLHSKFEHGHTNYETNQSASSSAQSDGGSDGGDDSNSAPDNSQDGDLLDIFKGQNGTTFATKHFQQPETAIEMLAKRGLIEKPLFSLYLNGENDDRIYSLHSGDLILGEIDTTLFTGDLTYVPVNSPRPNYWEFRIGGLELRQRLGYTSLETGCASGCPAILDTGSRLIMGHFDDVDRINRRLDGLPIGNGVYSLQCDLATMPDLVFNIGGTEFVLKPKDYVLSSYINNQLVECISSLKAIKSEQYPFWVLGEQFLRQHYVVFDYGERRLGFASSKHRGAQYDYDDDANDDYDEDDGGERGQTDLLSSSTVA